MESFRPAGRGNVIPDAGRTGERSGETRVFVCEGLGVHGEAPGLHRPQGAPGSTGRPRAARPRGAPGSTGRY